MKLLYLVYIYNSHTLYTIYHTPYTIHHTPYTPLPYTEIVSEDVADFEYTPKPQYPGPFTVVNLPTEETMLRHFMKHIQTLQPHILVTYNGDKFDWPYVETRCGKYEGLRLFSHLGIRANKGRCIRIGVYMYL
ncbi:hypothetical protein EON63_03695 [archaeon]|nr:MAG: hypothetical protein EON63_03695 [archaeon]